MWDKSAGARAPRSYGRIDHRAPSRCWTRSALCRRVADRSPNRGSSQAVLRCRHTPIRRFSALRTAHECPVNRHGDSRRRLLPRKVLVILVLLLVVVGPEQLPEVAYQTRPGLCAPDAELPAPPGPRRVQRRASTSSTRGECQVVKGDLASAAARARRRDRASERGAEVAAGHLSRASELADRGGGRPLTEEPAPAKAAGDGSTAHLLKGASL